MYAILHTVSGPRDNMSFYLSLPILTRCSALSPSPSALPLMLDAYCSRLRTMEKPYNGKGLGNKASTLLLNYVSNVTAL